MHGTGECRVVRVELQEAMVIEDFLPLPLGNSDVILGIQWLEKFGTMSTSWKTQTLKIQPNGKTITLKGHPTLGGISLKAMMKTIRKEKGGLLLELNLLQSEEEPHRSSFAGMIRYSTCPLVCLLVEIMSTL